VHAGRRARLESVQNAVDQARFVARRLTIGATVPYRNVPWFWSQQFDLKIHTVGIGGTDDERVMRPQAVSTASTYSGWPSRIPAR
jgi:3-phenylpropionate/trans-cinnamate dioxygenase ferredoxin reductase subunit